MNSPDSVLDIDDPGDDVALRFHYQHCYAAINAIRLITDASKVSAIICENHEDILIKNSFGRFVGLQIKTRLIALPPFKGTDVQVRSALVKFCALDAKFPGSFEAFDFTTNHGFWKEANSVNNLPWVLSGLRERGGIKGLRATNPLRQFVEEIASAAHLPLSAVSATLQKVVLRGHESDINSIRGTVREVVSQCSGVNDLSYSVVAQIADAIVSLARDASMKTLKGPIIDLYAPGTDLTKIIDDQLLSGKTISTADVATIIYDFKAGGSPYQDLDLTDLITPAEAPSDLLLAVRKLAKGGVEARRVINIEDLVRSFEALFLNWTRKYGAEEARKRYNNVLGVVQFEATEAQVHAEKAGEPYGSEMYANLIQRLHARLAKDSEQLYNCRPEHLIGAAGLLSQQCKVWWSSPFDVAEDSI